MDNPGDSPPVLFVGYGASVDALEGQPDWTIRRADTVEEAQDEIGSAGVAAVVTEYRLADGDVFDLLGAIRRDHGILPVILWTAHGDEALASEAIAAGVSEYVVRPSSDVPEHPNDLFDRLEAQVGTPVTARRARHLQNGTRATPTLQGSNALQGVLETSPVGIAIFDHDRTLTHVNWRAEELVGLTPGPFDVDSLAAQDMEILDADADPLPFDRFPVNRVRATGEPVYGAELGVRGADGSVTWLLVNSAPLSGDESGGTPAVVSAFQDITERKEATRRRAESERKFRAVFEESFDAMMIADDDTEYVDVNPAACELFGLSKDELLGRSIAEFAAEDYDFEAAWHRFQESDDDRGYFPLITADGEERTVEFAATPDIVPGRHLSVIRDVTERRERQAELELFRDVVDHSSDAIYIVEPATAAVIDVNDAACRMLGYDREQLLSMTVPDINPGKSTDGWDEFAESVKSHGERLYESTHQREDGSTFPVEVKVQTVSLDEDYMIGAVRDITDRKRRERELRASEEKFRSLVEAAPNPIFVADVETGEIVETNSAACTIRKERREELIGRHQSDLHPAEETERYAALFERHVEHGGTIDRFEDGSPVYMVTADGEQIPVAISAATVEVADRTLIHGIFRDVSEQLRYEDSLESLSLAAADFLEAESAHEIATQTVAVATEALNLTGAAVHFYDEQRGVLTPVAYSDSVETMVGDPPTFQPGESVAWRVYGDQTAAVYEDVRTASDVYNPGTAARSQIIVPLGEHGVIVIGDTAIAAFDDVDVELAEILAAIAESALDRIDREQALRARERESKRDAAELERVDELNDKIRSIIRGVVESESRREIEGTVCEKLAEIDRIAFAWVGVPDYGRQTVEAQAQAGRADRYLEQLELDRTADAGDPVLTAIETRQTAVVENIAGSVQGEPWREAALVADLRSTVAVPLVYDDVVYGVIGIYSGSIDAFGDRSVAVLGDLGELIAYAIHAAEQRRALHEPGVVELTFEMADVREPLIDLATRLGSELEVLSVSSRPDGDVFVTMRAPGVDPEHLDEAAAAVDIVEEVTTHLDTDPALVQLIVSGRCMVTDIAGLAAVPHSIVLSEGESTVTVSIDQARDVRGFIAQFRERYPNATLVARRDGERADGSLYVSSLLENLTGRQREILRAAFHSGFFEQPRRQTGSEIADSLGISQPAFSKQLRTSERKLLSPMFDPSDGG